MSVQTDPHAYAEDLVVRLNRVDGIDTAHIAETRGHVMVEFHMPDPDHRFPSAVNVDDSRPTIVEATIRLGSIGDRAEMSMPAKHRLEGQWSDVVLDAATQSSVLSKLGLDGRNIDLGDRYIDSNARPHVRLTRREDGYPLSPQEFVAFIGALAQRFESQFDTSTERL